uniref:protein-tyrosine-phosphatase n=2 Tax=Arion vulgaris TaxID=1028688 RepID=A0A0B7AHF1_9EUPU
MSKPNHKDIKKAIKGFIRHVVSLENAVDPDVNGFDAEYKMIQDAQTRNRRDNVFLMDVGKKENNLKKNRYKDILPYDDHRVVLNILEGDQDSDYINASKLKGVRGTGGYIATQGPLAMTVNDFWRMIWEYNVEIIFMACRIVESGKIKCKQYWNDQGKSEEFGNITVYTETEEKIMSDCVQRNFQVVKGDEVRHVTQYHYSGWPDHGIPDDAGHIRDMIGFMRQTRHIDQAPLLVHCSAGCGRTGAIIAIDHVWTILEEGKFDEKFSLFDLICNFREQRMSIVQTAEQYALVNKVLKSLCEEWLTKMASHTYENVKLDEVSEIDTSSSDVNIISASEDNPYEDGCSVNNHYQDAESAFSPGKSPIKEKMHVDGANKTQISEGKKVNSPSPYENVLNSEGKKQEVLFPQKSLLTNVANGEKTIDKSIVQVDSGSPTKQAQTSDMGGHKKALFLAKLGQTIGSASSSTAPKSAHSAVNGLQTSVHPSQFAKPQQLDDTNIYSVINKRVKSATEDTAAPNIVHRKVFKAPVPPSPTLKSQLKLDEVFYSVSNKTHSPLKSPGVAVFPSLQKRPSSASDGKPAYSLATDGKPVYSLTTDGMPGYSLATDGKPVYSLANDANSGSTYEVFDFQVGSSNIITSSNSGSEGRHPSSSSLGLKKANYVYLNFADLPGFKHRLPRVRGPIATPQTWTKI